MDGAVIEQWFSEYQTCVYNYLVHYVDRTSADDLLQETFLRAWKSLHTFRGDASPKTWLCRIARNVAIDFLRVQNRRNEWVSPSDDSAFDTPSSEPLPEEYAALNELKSSLAACIERLQPNYREVIVLHGILEMSIAETAEVTGWSQAKVRITYHRAIKALQRALTDAEKGGFEQWIR
ncbi:RNA polymerase sigma factor [Alicyclobacillus cycloheptanicus]|uniref:RNA polymerase sigma factor n=1 Tax=Alicyclobacillus cycloheptanicus TaxID=1457 RepID=A0ABT9XKR4_9BACL|nr:RNA polymerase sigma factor [Alicyclobacillus cycloheptanicus]MDQ0190900.1 RNA polymerase sigma-70 factor (ECF subfamily) [Alicyclobacillus cycloheptanicus]